MTQENFDWHAVAWPASRLAEAVEVITRKTKLASQLAGISTSSRHLGREENKVFERWFNIAARQLKIEAELVTASYTELDKFVHGGGPMLLRLPQQFDTHESYFLALLKSSWGRVAIIGPDLRVQHVSNQVLQRVLRHNLTAPFMAYTDELLAQAGVAQRRRKRARNFLAHEAIMCEGLGSTIVVAGWLLRPGPSTSLWKQARFEHTFDPLLATIGAFAVSYGLLLLSWVIIGRGAFNGHLDWGWLQAWALITFTIVIFKMLVFDNHSKFSMKAGSLLKRKLLYGTLQLKPDEIRHQGAGQFLGRVMESESLEGVVLYGSVNIISGVIMLLLNSIFLALGVGGLAHTALLLGWMVITTLIGWRYYQVGREWVAAYRQMTNDLVERMVGHRTRLAQEDSDQWHTEEDKTLSHYLALSVKLDRIATVLDSFIDRGWMVVALLGIASPLIAGSTSQTKLALTFGGILLTFQALHNLHGNITIVIEAMLAWDQVEPLLQASARTTDGQAPVQSTQLEVPDDEQSLLLAQNLDFRYRDYGPSILRQCYVEIYKDELLLLEGPSGGGKSTLAAVLAGLYPAESGLLLLGGLDQHTLGADLWRQGVLFVPQFQENHVFTDTLAFNLLMGHRWPPLPEDLAEAETICHELGLGHLLQQMPAGLEQQVGDSGWRLSHGERSRLYIARALLQKPNLLILDESFGALDPENLQVAMACVLKRSSTLLVIAHP